MRGALAEIAAGRPASLTPAQAREFAEAYAGHIRREEDELLLAARLIADDVLADIGRAMRARRGGGGA